MGKITRRELLAGMGAMGLLGMNHAMAAGGSGVDKPNIIFILMDDLGWMDLSCYGSKFYETPNIDRLASQGMRFTSAYAACPVCSPTRASILTGKYPARLGLTDWIPGHKQENPKLLTPEFYQELPLRETTIAETLKSAGYVSASIGKWHLGREPYWPEKQGFDLNFGGTHQGNQPSYFYPYGINNIKTGSKGEYLTDRLTSEAEKFIEANKDRPFFLYLSHYAVHTPLAGKAEVVEKYKRKIKPGMDQNNPVYAAVIESVDESVGRIMAKLDELKIADNTVFIFFSDNGGLADVTSNAPLRLGKGHLYEGGVREPLIVRWPGKVKAGTVCDTPMISTDFYPTMLEMAGLKGSVPDGVSIVPLLRQKGGTGQKTFYWHYPHYHRTTPSGAIRDGDWKLIEFFEDNHVELYNLKDDLSETTDLAARQPEKAQELRKKLADWRKSVNAAMPTPNPEYKP